jgi:SAM-dependent methyltransferase
MNKDIVAQLIQLNRDFYAGIADGFARSRTQPQPGFFELAEGWAGWFGEGVQPNMLDVGCGEGRLGRFLGARGLIGQYVGVDFSGELLEIAGILSTGTFIERDITDPKALVDLGQFGVVACMAALQHIPSLARRQAVVSALADCLPVGGILMMSNWQFLSSERQRRKIQDWGLVGLGRADLEANDYLLSWGKDGDALRYVCWLGLEALVELGRNAGISLIHHFYSDGKEKNLNLYTIFQKTTS